MTILNPYLSFKDNAREALEFYRSVFGGELVISTFGEFPGMVEPAENDLVMHGQLTGEDGLTLMGSDTPAHMDFAPPSNIALSISGDDEATLERYWNALAEGGTVTMPFDTPPWGGRFGMLVDKYGFSWMVAVNAAS